MCMCTRVCGVPTRGLTLCVPYAARKLSSVFGLDLSLEWLLSKGLAVHAVAFRREDQLLSLYLH